MRSTTSSSAISSSPAKTRPGDGHAGLVHRFGRSRTRAGATTSGPCLPPPAGSRRSAAARAAMRTSSGVSSTQSGTTAGGSGSPRTGRCRRRSSLQAMSVKWMSPVSSSSSLTRQQRPQPSQRLSHSARWSCLRACLRQNGSLAASRLRPSGSATSRSLSRLRLARHRRVSHCRQRIIRRMNRPGTSGDRLALARLGRQGVADPVVYAGRVGDWRRVAWCEFKGKLSLSAARSSARCSSLRFAGLRFVRSDERSRIGAAYARYAFAAFMDRFHVRGVKRIGVELACEGLTLGVGGLLVMLALAMPAFREVGGDDWLKKQDLAVTFLDRYGNEIGRRGIRHDDCGAARASCPTTCIKAVLATEDRRFFDHFGIDVDRHLPRPRGQRARRRRGAGRLVAHPAARQEPVPVQRAHASSARSRRPSWRSGSSAT